MKPVYLEFAGLQSYREKQSIDFTQLLGGGLFGIFGPTGSGKSTILDAITLALYGRVNRAGGDMRSVLNQHSRQIVVKFSFALRDAGGERVYRVERSLSQQKDGAVRTAACRLVETTDGAELVLADKEQALTAQVRAILGLTAEDFMRAVVLPQGKFAEFLQLTGADRRQMLERIFGLGRYGERLAAQVKARLAGAAGRLEEVRGRQQELGDASDEAVGQAERALAEAEAGVESAEVAHRAAALEQREAERVWTLQRDLSEAEAGRQAWEGRAQEAGSWRVELDLARRAARVEGPITERDQAAGQARTASVRQVGTSQALERTTAARDEAVRAHGQAQVRREQEAPGLTERQVHLKKALELEAEVRAKAAEAAGLAEKVARGKTLTADEEQRVATGEQLLESLQARFRAAQARIDQAEIPQARRQQVEAAKLALSRLADSRKAADMVGQRLEEAGRKLGAAEAGLTRAEAERQAQDRRLQDLEQELARLQGEPPADDQEVQAQEVWLAKAEGLVASVIETGAELARCRREQERLEADLHRLGQEAGSAAEEEARLARLADEARLAVEEARARLEAARQSEHAAALVSALQPGAPCPVCGSLEHPHPAAAGGGEATAAAESARAEAEKVLRASEAAHLEAGKKATAARLSEENALKLARTAAEAALQAGLKLDEATGRLPAAWRTLPAADLPGALAQQKLEHDTRRDALAQWKQQAEALRQRREDQARTAGAAAGDESARRATRDAQVQARDAAAAELARALEDAKARDQEFVAAGGGMDEAALAAAQRQIQEADQERARLQQEAKALGQEQEAREKELTGHRRTLEKYRSALQERQMQLAAAEGELRRAEQQLQAVAGGRPVAAQLAEVEEHLRRLETEESEARLRRETAERERAQAAEEHAAAVEALNAATARLIETEQRLQAALSAEGFETGEAAAAAARVPGRIAELEGRVQEYDREGDRLAGRVADLAAQLGGARLEAGQWDDVQQRCREAEALLIDRRDARTRAQQAREDLREKRSRWLELEEQRAKLAEEQGYLDQLNRMLAGRAFVEFLAREHMERVARDASERLGLLTRYRYALELGSDGGFIIRDDHNGGARRPVATLSGGETFLASLALALSLSYHIQLRGRYPLEFFFLDEGFGTLDPELLDTVVSALEQLHLVKLHVGVISHVPELRARLQRRVIVDPAEPGGRGSRLTLEYA